MYFDAVDYDSFVDEGVHGAPDLAVPQLGLGLPLELGVAQLDGQHAGQALLQVVTGEVLILVAQDLVVPRGFVDGPGHGGPEPRDVRPPLDRVDEVGEGEDAFEVAVVVLEPDVDRDAVPLPGEDDGRGEEGRLAAVQILDEGPYAPVEVVLLLIFNNK